MEKLREKMDSKCLIRSSGKRVTDGGSMVEENVGVVNEHGVQDEGLFMCDDEEMGAKVMLKSLNFWLYFFVYMFGATVGMVYLNNLGQIVESRGSSNISSLVSLASSFGFFGRIFPCLLDYHISRLKFKNKVSRPAMISTNDDADGSIIFLTSERERHLSIHNHSYHWDMYGCNHLDLCVNYC
ncbi:hypothetical protein HanIR_Chr11g0531091 [Helianthus annuus]|nr:hypothetical protein HanIR_Chr11g0531091 [Helianthus annuus]